MELIGMSIFHSPVADQRQGSLEDGPTGQHRQLVEALGDLGTTGLAGHRPEDVGPAAVVLGHLDVAVHLEEGAERVALAEGLDHLGHSRAVSGGFQDDEAHVVAGLVLGGRSQGKEGDDQKGDQQNATHSVSFLALVYGMQTESAFLQKV